jgi:hypothetical protein
MSPITARVHLLSSKVNSRDAPILSMVCDKECLVLFHGFGQLLKVHLGELSGQEVCPTIRMPASFIIRSW